MYTIERISVESAPAITVHRIGFPREDGTVHQCNSAHIESGEVGVKMVDRKLENRNSDARSPQGVMQMPRMTKAPSSFSEKDKRINKKIEAEKSLHG